MKKNNVDGNISINVVSLFSGIGGFEEGLRKSDIKGDVVFASEIDESAKISYSANFDVNNLYGDITKISEKDIPDHDLLLGGFPCQSFSIAGRQKGFDDTRGTLFFDVARILREKKPKFILLENVKNLISHNKTETIKVILNILNELGYTVDFTIINSYEAGVPQNRDRTYICGIYEYVSEKYEKDYRSDKVTALKIELNNAGFRGFNFFNNVTFSAKKKCIKDVLEDVVDHRYYFNSEKINNFLIEEHIEDIKNKQHKIVKLFDLPRDVHNDLERQRRVYSIMGISPTVLARADSTKIFINEYGKPSIRKVTAKENFYIQGFSKKFVDNIKATGMSDTQMYKQSGNAVSPPVIKGILNCLNTNYIKNEK